MTRITEPTPSIAEYSTEYYDAENAFHIDIHEMKYYEDIIIEEINLRKLYTDFYTLSSPHKGGFKFNGFLLYIHPKELYWDAGEKKLVDYILRLRPSNDPRVGYTTIFRERYLSTRPTSDPTTHLYNQGWTFERLFQQDHGMPRLYPYILYLSDFIHSEAQRKNYEEEKVKKAEKEHFYEKTEQFFKKFEVS